MNRRGFLATVAGGWVASTVLPDRPGLRGHVLGASRGAGHALRGEAPSFVSLPPADLDAALLARELPASRALPERTDVVIVGSGASGLSAAWRLAALGIECAVLELEPFVGGTSTYGTAGACPHPWGAHYLPAPNVEARAALRLLTEMGVVTGWDAAGRPRLDDRVLCHAPEERLFYKGEWSIGLAPVEALTAVERDELRRFRDIADTWSARNGDDGRAAFQIPVELSSRDPDIVALDRVRFSDWLDTNGFTSPFLRWYVRYAVLDDFGGEPESISAWAGLHYFASRKVRSEQLRGSHFLVWPEGNGRLIRELCERSRAIIAPSTLVTSVEETAEGVVVRALDLPSGEPRTVRARAAVLAVPAFIASRVMPSARGFPWPRRTSAPWVVANLHTTWPADPDLPWDSVLHGARGLGYVHAQHQRTAPEDGPLLTYYRAFGEPDVAAARASLLHRPWEALAEEVLADLAPAHTHLRDELTRMDVMVWGHAMPRPEPGFLGERPFEPAPMLARRVAWAHVDQSGMALFEQAQHRGVLAAEAVARALDVDPGETWT
ncbi:MAG: FAD-dependent oxidoreductase [Polyangiaceae bacterium]